MIVVFLVSAVSGRSENDQGSTVVDIVRWPSQLLQNAVIVDALVQLYCALQ